MFEISLLILKFQENHLIYIIIITTTIINSIKLSFKYHYYFKIKEYISDFIIINLLFYQAFNN